MYCDPGTQNFQHIISTLLSKLNFLRGSSRYLYNIITYKNITSTFNFTITLSKVSLYYSKYVMNLGLQFKMSRFKLHEKVDLLI